MNCPVDITNIQLHTPRLKLRPWTFSDLDDFYEYASVPGVGEMAGWKHHSSIDESRSILNFFITTKKTFALEFQSKVIGSLGIESYDEALFPELDALKGRELGFVLSKDYWGMGLMPEAVCEVSRWLFQEMKLDFLLCARFADNFNSGRVQEKCGFRFVKEAACNTLMGESKTDLYSILYNPQRG